MIAWLDCATGISGDKFLSALIEAGFELDRLRAFIASAGLADVTVETADVTRAGVRGTHLTVRSADDQPHRRLTDIRALIESGDLPAPVRQKALETFELIAEAEASVHGTSTEDVHFHEVGAVDSIVDVVGVALGLHELGVESLVASRVAVGGGTVQTMHGTLSVPAPATALLLEGIPVESGDLDGELTTPTGAALLRIHATGYGPVPAMTLRRTGHGAGTRDLRRPNITRLLLGETPESSADKTEDIVILESTIDHLSGEQLAHAANRLRDGATLDVWMSPVIMKKGRPAVVLSALTRPDDAAEVAAAFMAETGTLGVRVVPATRFTAARRQITLATRFGDVRFKVSDAEGATPRIRPEADDCERIAREQGLPVAEVSGMLLEDAGKQLG